ncbi:MAG: phytoene/squalene synthase family protein [Akkermansiaceae bacterium]
MSKAEDITRKAKSNLAFALVCLPKERKQDMVSFYAFCRIIDDLADDLDVPLEKRQQGLTEWRDGITNGFDNPDEIQRNITAIIEKYSIPEELFTGLIDGCASDLKPQRFGTWDDLKEYTYRVACCVGIISTYIFGCTHSDSKTYAVALGHALQLTNIMRDVEEDLRNGGRIYLPLSDMARFQYTERDLIGHVHDSRFIAMMTWHADRAEALYQEAIDSIHPDDITALKAAEAMRKIYHGVLTKMRADNFQVFKKRYSLSKARKAAILLSTLTKG